MQDTPDTDRAEAGNQLLVQDLERRIVALSRANESDFGTFTPLDWFLCVGGFVLVPYLLFLWFRP